MSFRCRWPLGWLYEWLACADRPSDTDLIFALAGRPNRKVYALKLFYEGRAPRVLLSTGRYEIRGFANLPLPVSFDLMKVASAVPPPQRHFFVGFEGQSYRVQRIAVHRLGTLSEIEALAKWLLVRPDIWRVSIVTSGAHLRRVRMCCGALLPRQLQLRLVAVPEGVQRSRCEVLGCEKRANVALLTELVKLLFYRTVLALQGTRAQNP